MGAAIARLSALPRGRGRDRASTWRCGPCSSAVCSPVTSALWSGRSGLLPPATAISPGTFVFTTEGAFAGLGVSHDGQAAIVPAGLLLGAVERLQQQHSAEAGRLRHRDPAALAIALHRRPALRPAWWSQRSIRPAPAAGSSVPTEVIEAIDGEDMRTTDHWRARVARATAGDTLTLRVRGGGGVRDVPITAAAPAPPVEPADDPSLGLRLRTIPKVGVEVLSVQPRSRAARAAIQQGDVITVVGGQPSPTPAQLDARVYVAAAEGGSVLVAIVRGGEHHVVGDRKVMAWTDICAVAAARNCRGSVRAESAVAVCFAVARSAHRDGAGDARCLHRARDRPATGHGRQRPPCWQYLAASASLHFAMRLRSFWCSQRWHRRRRHRRRVCWLAAGRAGRLRSRAAGVRHRIAAAGRRRRCLHVALRRICRAARRDCVELRRRPCEGAHRSAPRLLSASAVRRDAARGRRIDHVLGRSARSAGHRARRCTRSADPSTDPFPVSPGAAAIAVALDVFRGALR